MNHYFEKTSEYLKFLFDVKPNRRTGSTGNGEATHFFTRVISQYGYDIDDAEFLTLDHVRHCGNLAFGDSNYEVLASLFSWV